METVGRSVAARGWRGEGGMNRRGAEDFESRKTILYCNGGYMLYIFQNPWNVPHRKKGRFKERKVNLCLDMLNTRWG